MVFNKNDNLYEGFSQKLIYDHEDPEIKDLLLKKAPSDKKVRRKNYLKLQQMKKQNKNFGKKQEVNKTLNQSQENTNSKEENDQQESRYYWFWRRKAK